jgi:hypothetical protein
VYPLAAAAWNVLQPFSVVNRMAMFVYQDEEGKVWRASMVWM